MDDFCWSPPASFSDPQQCGKQYAYAVFWALQVTAGIGQDIIPRTLTELVFTCVMIVIGVLMYASIIGSVGSSLAAVEVLRHHVDWRIAAASLFFNFANRKHDVANTLCIAVAFSVWGHDRLHG